ncbi:MAG: hypothetical protein HQK76_02855 [Desulfobacterales bacterium]|nr:hypothetical protein [Desulfobacterales bacterium]
MNFLKIIPKFDQKKLILRLGVKNDFQISSANKRRIEKLSIRFKELITPKLYFRIAPIMSINRNIVEIDSAIKFKSIKIAKTLLFCNKIVGFIATIGSAIDDEISNLAATKQSADAFILDIISSLSIENMVETFWHQMNSIYKNQEQAISIRFSPGYCDWPIEEQANLFRFFDIEKPFVKLNNSFLMSPQKSISGVFGISNIQNANRVSEYNPCNECKKINCSERRKC